MSEERRINRSDNINEALELQLEATARKARLSTLILTEKQGLTVAATGHIQPCEEIAASSPQLAPENNFWQERVRDENGDGKLITVAPIKTEWGTLYLCAIGGAESSINAALLLGGLGVTRILA